MKKFHINFIAGVATIALFFSAFAPLASAQYGSDRNGGRSDNNYSYNSENTVSVDQHNNANISNHVSANSNTGGNSSYFGRGGSYTRTGNSDVQVGISNHANMNYANVGSSHSRDDNNWDWNKNRGNSDYHNDDNDYDREYKDNKYNDHDSDKYGYGRGYSKYMSMNHSDSWKDKDEAKDHYYNGHKKDYDNDDKDHGHEHEDGANYDHQLHAGMTGHEEVPHQGDPDGKGHASFTFHHEKGEVCVEMSVENIQPATAAHIHDGNKGEAGPIVVPLPTPNADGHVSGCVTVGEEMTKNIAHYPSDYYVNVHNPEYPEGAIRGQLSM